MGNGVWNIKVGQEFGHLDREDSKQDRYRCREDSDQEVLEMSGYIEYGDHRYVG